MVIDIQFEKSSNFLTLKELLKKQLEKYNRIEDIIIFGSAVKGKKNPKDIDIALVMSQKDYPLAKQFYNDLPKLKIPIHTTVVLWNEVYTEPIWKSLLAEGFSIKEDRFIKILSQ
jgi:predicted nucleotidyltransferase